MLLTKFVRGVSFIFLNGKAKNATFKTPLRTSRVKNLTHHVGQQFFYEFMQGII